MRSTPGISWSGQISQEKFVETKGIQNPQIEEEQEIHLFLHLHVL
jgi:hypothetical protein